MLSYTKTVFSGLVETG